jgi:heme O synthase-like polyprenyltransferase
VGPDRAKHIRNILIIVALAVVVWLLPGGRQGSNTVYNVMTLVLTAGLLFFAYRLYMEYRATIFGLGDRERAVLYAALGLAAFAILGTSKLWNEGGLGALIWFALLSLAAWGMYRVWRAYQEY